MNKTESTIIGIVIAILYPLLLFVCFWWSSAALVINHVLFIPEIGIAIIACTGLVLGIFLDILYLRTWVERVYTADLRVMLLVYLFCSVIAVAFFMGLPVGNLLLGTLAGVYIGRRAYHTEMDKESFSNKVKQVSKFTAVVTGVEALSIGLLAFNEDWVTGWIKSLTRMASSSFTAILWIGLVILLCAILMVVQFWCTKTMARIAYGHRKVVA